MFLFENTEAWVQVEVAVMQQPASVDCDWLFRDTISRCLKASECLVVLHASDSFCHFPFSTGEVKERYKSLGWGRDDDEIALAQVSRNSMLAAMTRNMPSGWM